MDKPFLAMASKTTPAMQAALLAHIWALRQLSAGRGDIGRRESARADQSGAEPARTCHSRQPMNVVIAHPFDRVLVLTADEIRRGVQPVNRRGVAVGAAEGFVDCYDLVSPGLIPVVLNPDPFDACVRALFRGTTPRFQGQRVSLRRCLTRREGTRKPWRSSGTRIQSASN